MKIFAIVCLTEYLIYVSVKQILENKYFQTRILIKQAFKFS
ncbi:hypothetical protein AWRIB429_1431 [Oenococcus oeni AWRIB429]|uniref:Uncharacterized protein n=1 Tax=Oenococcus oeni AWRIB429 TaxID=655225 RepID=D3LAQ1_OENOE|nr:hypothetical protein AWRIB429_1431 [Oenococcus oeni AWRIB429]SYW16995.1 conserved hypothetical protein [Oenococcus oeni]